jgi:hypothetical protein
MKIEPEKRERREKREVVAVKDKRVQKELKLLRRMIEETRSLLDKTLMRAQYQCMLVDAAAFEKRLKAGEEKFLSPEESAAWRDSIRRRQDVITEQLEARAKL